MKRRLFYLWLILLSAGWVAPLSAQETLGQEEESIKNTSPNNGLSAPVAIPNAFRIDPSINIPNAYKEDNSIPIPNASILDKTSKLTPSLPFGSDAIKHPILKLRIRPNPIK